MKNNILIIDDGGASVLASRALLSTLNSRKPNFGLSTQVFAFAPVIRGENKLEVRNESDSAEIILIGAIGKSWYDDSGITEQEFRNALKEIPHGKSINLRINSEGGSVKEGLGIYNAIKERRANITAHISGYALSIASVFPLAAGKVVSPKSAIWMMHKAWSWNQGNADDMRQAAEMLDAHDETLADIYAAETGKSKAEILDAMEKETWVKGADAVAWGLADETDPEEQEAAAAGGASVLASRPLSPDFIKRCKNISPEILNCIAAHGGRAPAPLSALPPQGERKTNQPQPKPNSIMKKKLLALLRANGCKPTDTQSLEELIGMAQAAVTAGEMAQEALDEWTAESFPPVSKKKPAVAGSDTPVTRAEFEALNAQLAEANKKRISDKVNTYVDAQKITKAEAAIFIAAAMTDEPATLAILDAKESLPTGGATAGLDIQIMDSGPNISKDGVQGSKILPELENIFAAHKEPAGATGEQRVITARARYDAMKAEFPRLFKAALRRDNGSVQAGNTFSATITTNMLILGVITKLYNRFAAANLFTTDAEVDPFKPLAAGIRKFNVTTTDGTKVGKNVTNFQTLAGATNGNPDSIVNAITITPDQYTAGGYITNAQLNSGYRIADIIEAKLIDLADAIIQVFTAPITVANFTTNAAVVSAPAAFGFSDLATLQGILKKTNVKNLLLDGEYIARIANTPGFFQMSGTVGGAANAWKAFGWDNIALNTEWAGAGANVRGFGCGQNAIGIISGLPLNPPEGIPGNIVQTGVAQLPDVQKAIATYVWFDPATRTLYFSFDIMAGATLIDETQGCLVKSA